jgi:hypothetical protein
MMLNQATLCCQLAQVAQAAQQCSKWAAHTSESTHGDLTASGHEPVSHDALRARAIAEGRVNDLRGTSTSCNRELSVLHGMWCNTVHGRSRHFALHFSVLTGMGSTRMPECGSG